MFIPDYEREGWSLQPRPTILSRFLSAYTVVRVLTMICHGEKRSVTRVRGRSETMPDVRTYVVSCSIVSATRSVVHRDSRGRVSRSRR